MPTEDVPRYSRLLRTKRFVPPLRTGCVLRERLHARLEAGSSGKLTLVCAAAGWGKTTLVSEWLHRTGRVAAWISLDEADSEPRRLVAYLLAALRDVVPGLAPGLDFAAPDPLDSQAVLIEILNGLVEFQSNVILVLDDLHHVEGEAAHDLLAFLLDASPPNLHVVITTRVDPPLPLARLRARGQLTEIRATQLRFSEDETRAFFEETMQLRLPTDALRRLDRRTEGWAAGLQMAALSLRGREDTEAFIESFAGSHRFVLDYLMEEVLAKMQPARREALLRLSILRELSAPIVDALLGGSGGQALLEELEAENLFLIPLDETRGTYRFHHLFGTLLGHELAGALTEPERRQLHVRAAEALERVDDVEEAFRHAVEGEDWDRAQRLLLLDADVMMLRRAQDTDSRIDRFPPDELARRPALLLKRAWIRCFRQRRDENEAALGAARAALARHPDPGLEAELILLQAIDAQSSGDHERSLRLFDEAEPGLPADNAVMRSVLLMHRAFGFVAEDRFDEAIAHAGRLATEAERIGDVFAELWARWFGAHVALMRGEPRHTIAVMESLITPLHERFGDRPPQSAAIGYVTLALAHYARGDLDRAGDWLERALEVMDPRIDPGNCCAMVLTQAELEVVRDPTGVGWREAIDRGEQLVACSDMQVFPARLRAHRVRHALHPRTSEDPQAIARAWLSEPGVVERTHPVYGGIPFPTSRKDFAVLVLARAQAVLGELDAATSTARDFLEAARSARRGLCTVEGHLALADIARRRDDPVALRAEVAAAVRAAAPERLVSPFYEHVDAIVEVAIETASAAGHSALARMLSAWLSSTGAPPTPPPSTSADTVAEQSPSPVSVTPGGESGPPSVVPPLAESLSERELEVLALVAEGLSNAEVGRSLFVAPSTVKKHLEHVFDKLGVRRRTQAVARARALGLV